MQRQTNFLLSLSGPQVSMCAFLSQTDLMPFQSVESFLYLGIALDIVVCSGGAISWFCLVTNALGSSL